MPRSRRSARRAIKDNSAAAACALAAIVVFTIAKPGGWTTLFTPDSEFYLSLGTFGSEVTSRAAEPAYYWTRLGQILPNLALNAVLPPALSHLAYAVLLLGTSTFSAFKTAHALGTGNGIASLTGLVIGLNVVVVSWSGDPYNTGTCIALLLVLAALLSRVWIGRSTRIISSAGMGVVLAWLVMSNPTAATVGAPLVVATLLAMVFRGRSRRSISIVAATSALAISGCAAAIAGFITVGQRVFAPLDWIDTVWFWGRTVNASTASWMSPNFDWVATEYALWATVGLAVFAIAAGLRFSGRVLKRRGNWFLMIVGVTPLASFGLQYARNPSALFEASFYNALLLPLPLVAATILAASLGRRLLGPYSHVTNPILGSRALILSVIIAYAILGRYLPESPLLGAAAALVLIFIASIAAIVVNRSGRLWSDWPAGTHLSAVLIAGVMITPVLAAQGMATARPAGAFGVVAQQRYDLGAGSSEQSRRYASTDLVVQEWLLDRVSGREHVAVVAAPRTDAVSAAAMQLWGPNSIYYDDGRLLPTAADVMGSPAQVLALYGFDPAACGDLAVSFRSDGLPTEIIDTDRFSVGPDTLSVCLLRLERGP